MSDSSTKNQHTTPQAAAISISFLFVVDSLPSITRHAEMLSWVIFSQMKVFVAGKLTSLSVMGIYSWEAINEAELNVGDNKPEMLHRIWKRFGFNDSWSFCVRLLEASLAMLIYCRESRVPYEAHFKDDQQSRLIVKRLRQKSLGAVIKKKTFGIVFIRCA